MFPSSTRQMEIDFTARLHAVSPHGELDERILQQKRIGGFLSLIMPESVDVVLTDNRSTLISSSRRHGRLQVRLHRMFARADDMVLKALSVFVLGTRSARISRMINAFIDANRTDIRTVARRGRKRSSTPVGNHYNLEEILLRVTARYFDSIEGVSIGWGRAPSRTLRRRHARRRSRALGTYCFEDASIRVNPVLDSSRVPPCVIEWVVYHEMLHHILPVDRSGSKARYHTAKFRAMERAFAEYETVLEWEKANIDWLMR